MTDQALDSYLAHPSFQEAMDHFQVGAWETGLEKLDELRALFPLDDELRFMRQEMQIKSKIDEYEIQDKKDIRNRFVKNLLTRGTIVVVLVGLMIWGGVNYSSWIQQQWNVAQQRIQNEALAIDLSIKFRNAQNLLLAGRSSEAQVLFQEVAELSPDFPELDYFLSETDLMIGLDEQYTKAVGLVNQGETQDALSIFREIVAQKPLYKDVSLQISNIERGFLLDNMVAEANVAFQEENWEESISSYESILALNPTENLDVIEQQLFLSYISAAEATLSDPTGTIEALESAEDYFKKALVLRPQNEEVLEKWAEARDTIKDRLVNSYLEQAQLLLAERSDSLEVLSEALNYLDNALELQPDDSRVQTQTSLVSSYLDAIDAYKKNIWAEVIILLEPVVEEDSAFANGVAVQTLYEAYIARGNDSMVSGLYEEALTDYQSAAVIARQSSVSTLLIFEAQVKAAKAQGLLFNYESAVALYQSALEILDLKNDALAIQLKNYLSDADGFVSQEDFRSAYLSYQKVLEDSALIYDTSITYTIENDEYLTQIANRYNTTVDAILKANDNVNLNNVEGRELVIPTLNK